MRLVIDLYDLQTMLLTAASRSVAASNGLGRRAASTIAAKYSKAVFGAALAKSPATLNRVAADLSAVTSVIQAQPEIGGFVNNPTLSSQERQSSLQALYSKIEASGSKKDQVSEITKNLFTLLSDNGRLAETEGVIEGFNELFAEYKGELTVTVTSAAPLARDVLAKLESTLKQSQAAQQAQVVKITNKVNPSVLGGLIVDFGDKTIDLSVSSRVTKLNNVLTQSV